MQRNRIVKGLLGGLLVVAMLLSFLPTLLLPGVAVTAAGGGLADTAWPTAYQNNLRNGLSPYNGPSTTPEVKWTFGGAIGEPVIGPDGTLYVLTEDCYLNAVNPADGSLKWRTPLNSPPYSESASVGSDGTVYVTNHNTLIALNPADGTVKWTAVTPGATDFRAPTIGDDGTIYITGPDNFSGIYAYNPDGTLKWQITIPHYYLLSNWPPGAAIADDGTIYFAGESSGPVVRAINPDGTEKWSFTGVLRDFRTLVLGTDGTVYAVSADENSTQGCLYALNPADGTTNWSIPLTDMGTVGIVIGPDGTLYLGGTNTDWVTGWLRALNPDGSEKWTKPWSGSITAISVGADGTLYVADYSADSPGGTLYALDPTDGAEKWSYYLSGFIPYYEYLTLHGLTIDSDGTLYVSTYSADAWAPFLFAFEAPTTAPVAAFTSDLQSGTAPLTVSFTDQSTNSPTSWAWDFDNNGVVDSTAQNPSHVYNAAGTYTVKLIATNAGGSDDEIKTDYISIPIYVDNLQPSWTAAGGGGVFSAYVGPPAYGYVSPGTTAVYVGREAGIIKAGLNVDPDDGHYWDEGLFGFQPTVTIDEFAARTLAYDVVNQEGTNPVWMTIEIDTSVPGDRNDNTVYQFVPTTNPAGWHTVDAAAGQWQLQVSNNGTGPMMTLSEVAAANTGLNVVRAYLRLGMGDSYHGTGLGTVAWVDKATISGVTYDFVARPTYTITASAGSHGSIDPSGDVVVNSYDSQSFSISPAIGFHVADVLVNGGSVGAVTSYTFTNVTANHTISASFAETVPAWDLNGDRVCNISDVVVIGLQWNETGTAGWIPEDVNNDGVINIGDVVVIGLHWNETW